MHATIGTVTLPGMLFTKGRTFYGDRMVCTVDPSAIH